MKMIMLAAVSAIVMSGSAFAYVQPTPPTAAMKANECKGYDGIQSVLTRGTCPSNGSTISTANPNTGNGYGNPHKP